MVVKAAVAPGPAAGNVQHREFIARLQFRGDLRVGPRLKADDRCVRTRGPDHRPRVMGREQLPGERNVGNVAAIGVDPLIENDRRTA